MTREEEAVKLLDELLVLYNHYRDDYSLVRVVLLKIAECRRRNPEFPISVSLVKFMEENGYFREEPVVFPPKHIEGESRGQYQARYDKAAREKFGKDLYGFTKSGKAIVRK